MAFRVFVWIGISLNPAEWAWIPWKCLSPNLTHPVVYKLQGNYNGSHIAASDHNHKETDSPENLMKSFIFSENNKIINQIKISENN